MMAAGATAGSTTEKEERPPETATTLTTTVSVAPTRFQIPALSNYLGQNLFVQAWYGGCFGFFLYFSMYALRRPFKAAKYIDDETGEKLMWFDTDMTLKTAIVLSQLVGYMTSKWIAIKVVSEAKGKQDIYLAVLGIVAELSLVLFGWLGSWKPDYSPFAMFLNGLMLGMVWGLTVSYGEGRTTSDFFLVSLSVSFIVSSGIVKDVALVALLEWEVDQFWTPALVGLLFLPLYFFCIFMLNQLPPPTPAEESDKGGRVVMTHQSRWDYFVRFWPGLLALWIGVMLLTAYRDYRDTFAVEIFEDLGYESEPGNLSKSESTVAGLLLIPIAALVLCRNNLVAFQLSLLSLVSGSVLLLLTVWTFLASDYSGFVYYVLTGVASYLAYVPYNSVLYERLIAVLHVPCNVAYLMAVMDALGYLGVFALYLTAEFSNFDGHLATYNKVGQWFGFATIAVYLVAAVYFLYYQRHVLYVRDGIKYVPEDTAAAAPPAVTTVAATKDVAVKADQLFLPAMSTVDPDEEVSA